MRILKQFDSLVIDDFEEEVYSYPDHAHTYFEMVYIHKGCGEHYLNSNVIPYRAGDLFITSPGDHHYFNIRKSTHFTFIKFTEGYYDRRHHLMPDDMSGFTPAEIMQLNIFKEYKPELEEPCRSILKKTVENIVLYDKLMRDTDSSPIVFYQLLSILGMIRDAARKMHVNLNNSPVTIQEIAAYIHQYIYDRDKLHIAAIAQYFRISSNYFSTYFKRVFGLGYRDYIAQYRNKLIEKRLLAGTVSLREIAHEFDFSDESHLIKYFKKQYGINPSEFRSRVVPIY